MRSSIELACVCAFVAASACSCMASSGDGPATPHCTRQLIDLRAVAGTIHWSSNGSPVQTIPFDTTCSGDLTSTLDEDDGSITDDLQVSCAAGVFLLQFSAQLPDVRSLSGSTPLTGGLHITGPTDCYVSVASSINVTSSRGGAAPMPDVVTSDFVRDFTVTASTSVDDSCIKASWSMTTSFALPKAYVGYGTETCITPV